MKTILKTLLLVVFIAHVAHAQGPVVAGIAPVLEAGVGYSYVDAGVPSQSRLGMNGIQLVGNADISRRFGVTAEWGYARSFDAYNSGRSADIMTYMAGPVFYAVRKQKLNVFAHVLLGAARETGINYEPNGQIVLGYTNRFAWAGGAGVQYRISRTSRDTRGRRLPAHLVLQFECPVGGADEHPAIGQLDLYLRRGTRVTEPARLRGSG